MTKLNVKRLSRLKTKIEDIQTRLQKEITNIMTATDTSNYFWTQKTRDVKKIYEEMRYVFRSMYPDMVNSEYYEALNKEIQSIKQLKFKKPIAVNYTDVMNSQSNKQTIESVLNDGMSTYLIGLDSGQKTLNKYMRLTQQILVEEKKINQLVEDGFYEKGSSYGSKKALYKEMTEKLKDGKTITVINKNGKQMNFDPKYYTEMVARTKIMEANNTAVINTALDVGADLVQVSSHNTDTPLCQEFEGKIYSISGKDPDFPALEEIPPFHPNCLHSLTVVFREVLERRGIDDYIAFSNGQTETHPTRESHIPVSER